MSSKCCPKVFHIVGRMLHRALRSKCFWHSSFNVKQCKLLPGKPSVQMKPSSIGRENLVKLGELFTAAICSQKVCHCNETNLSAAFRLISVKPAFFSVSALRKSPQTKVKTCWIQNLPRHQLKSLFWWPGKFSWVGAQFEIYCIHLLAKCIWIWISEQI